MFIELAIAGVLGLLTIGIALMSVVRCRELNHELEMHVDALRFFPTETGNGDLDSSEQDSVDSQASAPPTLPGPIRQHLQFALGSKPAPKSTALIHHNGLFRTSSTQNWFPVEGAEYISMRTPGFIWSAKMTMLPGIWMRARDSLLSGTGRMHVRLWSLFTIVDATGPEINQGALTRWIAELVWAPMGLCSKALQWEEVDDKTARVKVAGQGETPVSGVFHVDEAGKISSFECERYMCQGGMAVLAQWKAVCGEYKEYNGVKIPSTVEVSWETEQPFSYAKFNVTSAEFVC
jgi:hypothetical protein